MAGESLSSDLDIGYRSEKNRLSVFDLPSNFFEGCCCLSGTAAASFSTDSGPAYGSMSGALINLDAENFESKLENSIPSLTRWTCKTCGAEFESLLDQRAHFKSDFHRLNIKLSLAGKNIIKEEDLNALESDSFDVSSVSGSEDEADNSCSVKNCSVVSTKQKLFIRLNTGDTVSVWKCLLQGDGEDRENDAATSENKLLERLRSLCKEERTGPKLRIVLLAQGGHFAGCVFSGSSVVAHKTFHRYVVRAKAGNKQSSKDASGRAAHSAGAALRRYNEIGLKKDIQYLLASWEPYFRVCSCIFVHAPSNNRQLLWDGDKPLFYGSTSAVRHVPLSVRRPTFKESKRVYYQLTNLVYEVNVLESNKNDSGELVSSSLLLEHDSLKSQKNGLGESISASEPLKCMRIDMIGQDFKEILAFEQIKEKTVIDENRLSFSEETSADALRTTPLHEAASSDNSDRVMQLLEQGLDPCIKDIRGRTPYMLASEKEVRNTFRRFMALNPDKWDWNAAKVPSALTKEMEDLQAAKQAEKDAKRKARNKELKKLRKAREKKLQADTSSSQNNTTSANGLSASNEALSQGSGRSHNIKEEERKSNICMEREMRAAAAERRMFTSTSAVTSPASGSTPMSNKSTVGLSSDLSCSCCGVSLIGVVPFHRYNYKYCSTSCMHVHREMIEES